MECVGRDLDDFTRVMHEGTLTTGEKLIRPHRGRPMFVGVQLTGSRAIGSRMAAAWSADAFKTLGDACGARPGSAKTLVVQNQCFAICDLRVNRSIQSATHFERFTSSDSTSQHQHFLLRVIAILALCPSFSAIL